MKEENEYLYFYQYCAQLWLAVLIGLPLPSIKLFYPTARRIISMAPLDDNNVKVFFQFFGNVLDKWTVAAMWVQTVDKFKGLYRIDNVPFFTSIASGDVLPITLASGGEYSVKS